MSIYLKTFLAFALAVTFLTGGILILTSRTLLDQFSQQERYQAEQRAKALELQLLEERRLLSSAALKWGLRRTEQDTRDRTAFFLPESLDFAVSLTEEGELRGSELRADAADWRNLAPLLERQASDLAMHFPPGSEGSILIGKELALATLSRTDRGTLVFAGALLSQARLSKRFLDPLLRIRTLPVSSAIADPELSTVLTRLSDSGVAITPIGESPSVRAFIPLRGFRDGPVGLVEISSPRSLYHDGEQAVRIFLVSLAVLGGILVLVFWALLDRVVLSRVRSLHQKVEEARRSGTLPLDLRLPGGDELSALASSIQQLSRTLDSIETNYRAVVEDQSELICRYDAMLRLTFVNEAFVRYFGGEKAHFLGRSAIEFVHPADRSSVHSSLLAATAETAGGDIVHRVLRGDGETRWHRRTFRCYFEDGLPSGGQSVSSDITEQHTAEIELANSEHRYRAIFETAHEGLLVLNGSDQTAAAANPAFLTLFGLLHGDVLGERFWDLPPFRDLGDQASGLDLVIHGRRQTTELVLQRPGDAGRLFIEVEAKRYRLGDQEMLQLYFRDITERQSNEQTLRQLTTRILKLQDEERRRIARELHDSTAQNLAALQMNIKLLEPLAAESNGDSARLLRDSREIAETCSREIRTLSYLLHPPLLDEVGLVFALRWLADGFRSRTGIETHTHLPDSLERMPEEIETTFFRVAQEALSNVFKHAKSDTVELRLSLSEAGVLALEIEDHGKGFEVDRMLTPDRGADVGVGLVGMRERLRQLDGTLIIKSSPAGTLVRAELLLTPA